MLRLARDVSGMQLSRIVTGATAEMRSTRSGVSEKSRCAVSAAPHFASASGREILRQGSERARASHTALHIPDWLSNPRMPLYRGECRRSINSGRYG